MWHSLAVGPRRTALATAGVMALALTTTPPIARAQVTESSIELRLLSQPMSHGPEDDFGIKLAIKNGTLETLSGFRLSVATFDRVVSRSALHESFESVSGLFPGGSLPKDFPKLRVLPGESVTVTVDDPVASLPLLAQAAEGGVYPLEISLFDTSGAGVPLDSVITPLVYYPSEPETRLNFVLVMPVNDPPSRGPDGAFVADDSGRAPLETALGEDGWLTGLLDALENKAGSKLHLALAPTPRLLEELADMSDGFTRVTDGEEEQVAAEAPVARAADDAVARVTDLLGRRGVQPLLVPYSFPDLPALASSLDPLALAKQINVAQAALSEVMGVGATELRWLFPPAGRLDATTLDRLALTPGAEAARRTFFSETSLTELAEPSGCPGTSPSFTCPVQVQTPSGPVRGFPYDSGLRERFAELVRGSEIRLALQRLFAETAMIREELPGASGRVVHATVPSLWHPSPRISKLLFRGFSNSQWLTTLTPAQGMARSVEAVERQIVAASPPVQDQPDESFFALVNAAATLVNRYGEIEPPAARLERLERNVLVGHSRSWWGGQDAETGADFALASRDEAEEEMGKITIGGLEEITLTSRQGEIQFPLFNGTDYPVTLKVLLDSDKLDVTPSEIQKRFEGTTQQITFEATAQVSGTFPVRVSVETPRSGFPITSKVITIRSTKFNQIALGITIGALVFLILFYAVRAIRRRRRAGVTAA